MIFYIFSYHIILNWVNNYFNKQYTLLDKNYITLIEEILTILILAF